MNYLKKYGLSDDDLQEIYDNLSDEDWMMVTNMSTRVERILDYFTALGINNFKDMFIYKVNIFYQHVDDLQKYISESEVPNIIEKLKEDINNFELLGL